MATYHGGFEEIDKGVPFGEQVIHARDIKVEPRRPFSINETSQARTHTTTLEQECEEVAKSPLRMRLQEDGTLSVEGMEHPAFKVTYIGGVKGICSPNGLGKLSRRELQTKELIYDDTIPPSMRKEIQNYIDSI